jgi:5-hydroxyisourate hydrolase-like protein (transthyretin family)
VLTCHDGETSPLVSTRQFTVRNIAPVVTVTSPGSDATVSGSSVRLSATAVSDAGASQHITQVEFFVDGASHGVDTLAPFESTFSSRVLTNGPHTVHAVAEDSAGLVGESVSHSFDVANFRSNLTIGTDRDRTTAGSPLTIVGALGNINEGTPIAGKPVAVYVRRADQSGWSRVTTVNSDSAGRVTARHAPLFTSYYRLQYAGDARHSAATSATVRVTVSPVVRLSMTATSVRRSIRLNGLVKITPATGGQPLELSIRKVGGSWMALAAFNSAPTATGLWVTIPRTGYYDLRILRKANAVGNAVHSNVVRIRVI